MKCLKCSKEYEDSFAFCPYCQEPNPSKVELKKCPYCAEVIQAEAIKCRFCGSKLSTRPPREPLASKYQRHKNTINRVVIPVILVLVVIAIVVTLIATRKPPTFSFSVDKSTEAPSVVGTYTQTEKDSDSESVSTRTLDMNSDGTYLITDTPSEAMAFSGETTKTFPGVWSDMVGGKGTWHPNDYVKERHKTDDSYKLIGRAIKDDEGYWYITEDGSITTQMGMELYERQ